MSEPIFNHRELYEFLYNGNTSQAIKIFVDKTNPEDFTPFLRNAYLSSLNFGIYNYILLRKNLSLHECCAENAQKILLSTKDTFIETGIDIISSYGNDTRCMIECYSNPHIRAAVCYIHRHLSEPLSLETISSEIHINSSYLSDLFKKEVGYNFCDYVHKQRIRTAKKLLTNTKLSIQDIAERCGYTNVGYFSTCFKKITQKSPSEYRNEFYQ